MDRVRNAAPQACEGFFVGRPPAAWCWARPRADLHQIPRRKSASAMDIAAVIRIMQPSGQLAAWRDGSTGPGAVASRLADDIRAYGVAGTTPPAGVAGS